MRCHILAQTDKMNLVHGAKIQDSAGVLRHGQQSVFIRCLIWLLQMVPLFRIDHRPNVESAEYL